MAISSKTSAAPTTSSSSSLAPRQAGAPTWAPAREATIHPGVNTDTAGSCTSNFIFYQGSDIYIGQAAHCSSTGGSTDTNGCTSGSMPEGTKVTITGASAPGTMVYNSWIRMQARGETDESTCAYNDLALVKLDPADHSKVNPSVPTFGGPTGLRTEGLASLDPIFSYGNSILRQGVTLLSPKYGALIQEQGDGWSHIVGTLTPGIPGDSGSGFFDQEGKAFGVLSTLSLAPLPASNGVGDLAKELAYARSYPEFSNLQLATGTEPFKVALPDLQDAVVSAVGALTNPKLPL
ncbi:hypothetical protein IE53DRAFT_309659 [Violaceomyces palustris]|uniref:Uncharacterized protein n=1 Tax=Violaceomyces palustris TaxID=1673888 RepID=A0ACD0P6Y1_9BASI|nr:hypothetical protein IE53DRAFT_309659 [Violaceomyces palustris]